MALGTPVVGTITFSTAGGASVSPTYPASIVSTDAVFMFVGQKPATANGGGVTTPTGWTLQGSKTGAGGYGATLGADTGNTNLYVYTKDTVTGSESGALAVTLADNDIAWGAITRVPSGGGSLSFATTTGEDTTGDASLSITGAGDPGFNSGDLAFYAINIASDAASLSIGAITASGATFGSAASRGIPSSALGNDIRAIMGSASCSAGPSSGAPTFTATASGTVTNARGPGVVLRIRENVSHATSGALVGPGAAVAGSAQRNASHPSTGALTGQGSALSGSASRYRQFTTSGALTGQGAVISGAALRFRAFGATGDLVGPGAVIVGAADHSTGPVSHATSGDLAGQGSSIAGVALRYRVHDTSGQIAGQGAVVAGTAIRYREFVASGELVGPGSEVSGAASRFKIFTSSGDLVGPGSVIVGAALHEVISPAQCYCNDHGPYQTPARGNMPETLVSRISVTIGQAQRKASSPGSTGPGDMPIITPSRVPMPIDPDCCEG